MNAFLKLTQWTFLRLFMLMRWLSTVLLMDYRCPASSAKAFRPWPVARWTWGHCGWKLFSWGRGSEHGQFAWRFWVLGSSLHISISTKGELCYSPLLDGGDIEMHLSPLPLTVLCISRPLLNSTVSWESAWWSSSPMLRELTKYATRLYLSMHYQLQIKKLYGNIL